MPSHAALPSSMANANLAPASPNRTHIHPRSDFSAHEHGTRNLRRVSFVDSSSVADSPCRPTDVLNHFTSPSPGSGPSTQCHSTLAARHPYLAHAQATLGSPSRSPYLDDPSPASPSAAVTPRVCQGSGHGFNSGPCLGNEDATPIGSATSFVSHDPRFSSEGNLGHSAVGASHQSPPLLSRTMHAVGSRALQPVGLNERLPGLPSGHIPGTVGAQAADLNAHLGLSPSFGPGPTLVSQSAPPTTAALGSTRFHKSPPAPSIGSSSASSFARTISPPSLTSPVSHAGVSMGALPSVAPAQSHGTISPLYLGAGMAPLPALTRSMSDETASLPSASNDTTESLRQQLSFLLQSWMSDRESSRTAKLQTEQDLHRARSAMDNQREQWLSDRAALERHMESLRAQVLHLEKENAALRAYAHGKDKGNGAPSPPTGQQLGRAPGSLPGNTCLSDSEEPAAVSLSSNPSQQSGSSRAYIFSPPPGLECAPRRHHIATPGSSRTSPSGPPAPSHVTPLDPRSQPQHSPPVDFMDPLAENAKAPAPIIDVQEIDPKLEGIPIKAKAVHRSTFTSATHQPSLSTLHHNDAGGDVTAIRPARHSIATQGLLMDRNGRGWRAPRRDQTMQALSAEESRRLTMHAGHTPNHSLSLLPTTITAGGESIGDDSARDTPSTEAHLLPSDAAMCRDPTTTHADGPDAHTELDVDDSRRIHEHINDGNDGTLEPQDDVALKGPLMVKNIPAQDDVFFAKLDEKLESVVSGEDALPSVLRASGSETGEACEPHHSPEQPRHPEAAPLVGADGGHDFGSTRESDGDEESDNKDIEPEVPLKMKKTQNFGAPFGFM
ncbi:hypothetical protein HIM_01487 [Hirsutella minnesotensis 3608]|nr:hypothetical protein HIM_01487 [Hirsutella minnesotensis 3608]